MTRGHRPDRYALLLSHDTQQASFIHTDAVVTGKTAESMLRDRGFQCHMAKDPLWMSSSVSELIKSFADRQASPHARNEVIVVYASSACISEGESMASMHDENNNQAANTSPQPKSAGTSPSINLMEVLQALDTASATSGHTFIAITHHEHELPPAEASGVLSSRSTSSRQQPHRVDALGMCAHMPRGVLEPAALGSRGDPPSMGAAQDIISEHTALHTSLSDLEAARSLHAVASQATSSRKPEMRASIDGNLILHACFTGSAASPSTGRAVTVHRVPSLKPSTAQEYSNANEGLHEGLLQSVPHVDSRYSTLSTGALRAAPRGENFDTQHSWSTNTSSVQEGVEYSTQHLCAFACPHDMLRVVFFALDLRLQLQVAHQNQKTSAAPSKVATDLGRSSSRLPSCPSIPTAAEHIQDVGALCAYINACSQSTRAPAVVTLDVGRRLLMSGSCNPHEQRQWAAAEVWLERTEHITTDTLRSGLFRVAATPARERDAVGVCVIGAKHASTICGAHIVLQGRRVPRRSNILLLHNASATFEGCVIEGGAVVCFGTSCQVTFRRCTFKCCCVVALSGANVAVEATCIENPTATALGLGIYACGASTVVRVHDVAITGGAQGVAVHGGACMYGSKLAVSQCFITGVESKDEGSAVDISDGSVRDFSRAFAACMLGSGGSSGGSCSGGCLDSPPVVAGCGSAATLRSPAVSGELSSPDSANSNHASGTQVLPKVTGVSVHQGGSAALTRVEVQGQETAVVVRDTAVAKLNSCIIRNVLSHGCCAHNAAQLQLRGCSITNVGGCGVFACGSSTHMHLGECLVRDAHMHGVHASDHACVVAEDCQIVHNGGCGGLVGGEGVLEATRCSSKGNRARGFWATGGSQMKLVDCKSRADEGVGCGGEKGASVVGERVLVNCSSGSSSGRNCLSGFRVESGATAELTICSVSDASESGMVFTGRTTKACMVGCTVSGSKGGGVGVLDHAYVTVEKSAFSKNNAWGACAQSSGVLELTDCGSEGEGGGSFCVEQKGYMKLLECVSTDCMGNACSARSGGFMAAEHVKVHGAARHAFSFEGGASGDVGTCAASNAGGCGVAVEDAGTSVQLCDMKLTRNKEHGLCVTHNARASMRGSDLDRNGWCGVMVSEQAQVDLTECKGTANGNACFSTQNRAHLTLTACTSSDAMHDGCCVAGDAHFQADGVTVCRSGGHAFSVASGASAQLHACVAASATSSGLQVCGRGSTAQLQRCRMSCNGENGVTILDRAAASLDLCSFTRNCGSGAVAEDLGRLSLTTSCSVGNSKRGFWAEDKSTMTLVDCRSANDAWQGCGAKSGSEMHATCVEIHSSGRSGFRFESSVAVLKECSSSDPGMHGVSVGGAWSSLRMIGGRVTRSAMSGVCVASGAQATLDDVIAVGSTAHGFVCDGEWDGKPSKLAMFNCECDSAQSESEASGTDSGMFALAAGGDFVSRQGGVLEMHACSRKGQGQWSLQVEVMQWWASLLFQQWSRRCLLLNRSTAS